MDRNKVYDVAHYRQYVKGQCAKVWYLDAETSEELELVSTYFPRPLVRIIGRAYQQGLSVAILRVRTAYMAVYIPAQKRVAVCAAVTTGNPKVTWLVGDNVISDIDNKFAKAQAKCELVGSAA